MQVALRSNLSSGVLFAPNTFDPQANAAYGADPFVYSPLETARTKVRALTLLDSAVLSRILVGSA